MLISLSASLKNMMKMLIIETELPEQISTCTVCQLLIIAGPRSTPNSRAKGPGFDTWSGHILLFLFPLSQEGQMSVTGNSMCTKYWLTA